MCCLSKIDGCDIVYLVDDEAYVGKSGLVDMGYTYSKGKELYALEPIDDPAVTSLLKGVVNPDPPSIRGGAEGTLMVLG